MGTVMDYIQWRGDLRFSQDPFNDVDALILAMLSYLHFKGIVPGVDSTRSITLQETAERYFSKHPNAKKKPSKINLTVSTSMDAELVELLEIGSQSPRFAEMRLSRYEEKTDFDVGQQFAAVTFSLPNINRQKVVAFRGTDNTLIGWKEDFQMAYTEQIPAQESASGYLERSIGILSGKVVVCGHSKGGNLAVYAASHLSRMDRSRISRIINFDGPGFNFSILPRASFSQYEHKVVNYVPEESVVGMLMESIGKRHVITSSARAVYQHNPTTWETKGAAFISGSLSTTAKWLEDSLKNWLAELSLERRKAFIDALFDVLGASEGKKVDSEEGLKEIGNVIKNFNDLDGDTKKMLSEVFVSITVQAKNTLSEAVKEKLSPDK